MHDLRFRAFETNGTVRFPVLRAPQIEMSGLEVGRFDRHLARSVVSRIPCGHEKTKHRNTKLSFEESALARVCNSFFKSFFFFLLGTAAAGYGGETSGVAAAAVLAGDGSTTLSTNSTVATKPV